MINTSFFYDQYAADVNYIVENVPTLYKYTSIENCISILKESAISFKHPSVFNDPFDCYHELIDFSNPSDIFLNDIVRKAFPLFNRGEIRAEIKKIKQLSKGNFFKYLNIKPQDFLLSNTRITCFSEIYDSLLMWSHYSMSNTGVCIGFDRFDFFNDLSFQYDESAIFKVKYFEEFEKNNYFKNESLAYIRWISSKSKDWEYEREIRIYIRSSNFINAPKIFLQPFNIKNIKSLFLGSKIENKNIEILKHFCKINLPSLKIYRMKENVNKFQLIPELLF